MAGSAPEPDSDDVQAGARDIAASCMSCGTVRPVEQMEQALTVFWEPIPDGWQCRDAEACFRDAEACFRNVLHPRTEVTDA